MSAIYNSESESDTDTECSNVTVSVSDLNTQIRGSLTSTFGHRPIKVEGEVSNFKPSRDVVFFTLKDDSASISAVMWNYAERKDELGDIKEGTKVEVTCKVTLFQKSGRINVNVLNMKPIGEGELHQQFIATQKKYSKLGYFDTKKKKKLPANINSIGVITAKDGAALQDFIYALRQNNYVGKIHVRSCLVQGNSCPDSVANEIKYLDKMNLDVIVVTRGGGSFEDLCGFSNPKVIEALYNAKTCTMSAIGHEVDNMLSDFVADVRAPTPSLAGEALAADTFDPSEIDNLMNSLEQKLSYKLERGEHKLLTLLQILKSPQEVVDKTMHDISMLESNLQNAIFGRLIEWENQLNDCNKTLNKQDDRNTVLSKGYSLIMSKEGDHITTVEELKKYLKKSKKLKILMQDGEVSIKISNLLK
jgi:exodeoxyribonuclease VII large subunit